MDRNGDHFRHRRNFPWTVLSDRAPAPSGLTLGLSCIRPAFGLGRTPEVLASDWSLCSAVSTCWLFWGSFSHCLDSLCFFSVLCRAHGSCGLSSCSQTLRFRETSCHLTLLKMLALVFGLLFSCCFIWGFKEDPETVVPLWPPFSPKYSESAFSQNPWVICMHLKADRGSESLINRCCII